jgi:capsular exopolysaccharide synthesis family protein
LTKAKTPLNIVDYFNMELPETTEFRRVLFNVNGKHKKGDKLAILVTSAMLSEGKSVISSFLAMTSAKSKSAKTLLIDFDLRRPKIHKLFHVPLKNGISNILVEGIACRNAIKRAALENLDILTAGDVMENPSELFNGSAIHRIIDEMKFYYDIIIVDSPPLIPVMDPIILLEELDGVILVVKAGATQRDVVLRARELLDSQKDKIIGVIVNNSKQSLPYYYNYSYYGYKSKPSAKT